MQLKQSLIIAFALSVLSISTWEFYWRSQGKYPTLNDEKALWTMHRADVETASKDDYVILGSSRAYFDIQVNAFEKATGKNPYSCHQQAPRRCLPFMILLTIPILTEQSLWV